VALASVQSHLASANVNLASVKRELAGKAHEMGEAAARGEEAREVLRAQVVRLAFCPFIIIISFFPFIIKMMSFHNPQTLNPTPETQVQAAEVAANDTRLEAPEAHTLHLKHFHTLDPTPETHTHTRPYTCNTPTP